MRSLPQPVDDVGGNSGLDRSLDRRRVALVDEHRNRPADGAADLEHRFEHVAAGVFQIDQDDVGIDRVNARQQALHLSDMDDLRESGLPQPFLEDRGPDRAFVDDHDFGDCSALIAHSPPAFHP